MKRLLLSQCLVEEVITAQSYNQQSNNRIKQRNYEQILE